MLLKDVVKIDTQGKFISAVQLSDYDKPEDNLSLVKSYIFAESAPDTYGGQLISVGSIDLLKHLRLSFNNNSSNCFAVVANYGHGKSHLALVLSNYFGKPARSPEVKKILERIDQAVNNPAKTEDYHEFKRQNDRFLVVRLSGDTHKTLREQFFPAIQKALQEHKETQSVELPFWNQQAKIWLEGKLEDKQAKKFLKDNYGTDVPGLLADVEENVATAYEQYVELFKYLNNNVSPSAEGNFDFKDAVKWIVEVCQKSKALSGVLVLFDEFSQFVQRYSEGKAIGDLQNLLLGIQDHRGKALFLAFAQHDPDEVADQYAGGQALQSIKRELNRIEKKYALYSLMESVLDSYLSQSDNAWDKMIASNPRARGSIFSPTELVWELYSKRYDRELRWRNDKFRDVLAKGCFPLHPFTTALLSHLKMQTIDDDPRTILRFVRDRYEQKQNEPIFDDSGKINRIYPIELVDYFQGRIATKQLLASYENAIKNVEQTFAGAPTYMYHAVLKALLLQEADQIVVGHRQVEILSEMAGLDEKTTLQTLKELSKKSITKYDENLGINSFWPVSVDPQALEDRVKNELANKKFNTDTVYSLNDNLEDLFTGTTKIPVPVDWGSPDDWAAKSVVITRETLTSDFLKQSLQAFSLTYQGFKDGNRGLVCWLLALDETDIEYFNKTAPKILHDTFSEETPPPVIMVLPKSVNTLLSNYYLRYKVLEDLKKDRDLIKKVTQVGFDSDMERTKKTLIKALGSLFGDDVNYRSIPRKSAELVVHQKYKSNLTVLATITIDGVLRKLYDLAYPYHPPKFFDEFAANPKKGAKTVPDSVKVVARNLIHNKISSTLDGMSIFSRDRVCKQQLMQNWRILSNRYYIQEPDAPALLHAWNHLENAVKVDDKEVSAKTFIPNLFVPPFGFDYNTATLLFTAWIGKNKTKLSFSANNKVVGIEYLEKLLESESPQEFLGKICTQNFTITRRDVEKAAKETRKVVEDIQRSVSRSQEEADSQVISLKEILNQGVLPEDEKETVTQALNDLITALEIAKRYDVEVKKLRAAISKEDHLKKLLGFENDLKGLEVSNLVVPTQPRVAEIQKDLADKIEESAKETCREIVNLRHIEDAGAARSEIRDYKTNFERKGYKNIAALFTQAEEDLEKRVEFLRSQAAESSEIEQLNAMTPKADLVVLYQYQDAIAQLNGSSSNFEKVKKKKLDEISTEILGLETFAKNVEKTAKEISPEDLRDFYESMIIREGRYSGSDHEKEFREVKKYIQVLQLYFEDLRSVTLLPIRSQEDASEARERLEKIEKKYLSKVSKKHKSYLQDAKNKIDEKIQEEYEKAEKIIKEVERGIKTSKATDLRRKLETISFTNKSIASKIKEVSSKIEEKETQDVIGHIENLFKSIKDRKQREECIKRLQKVE